MQSEKAAVIGVAELNERTRNGNQGRRLIVMAVKSAKRPVQVRYIERGTEARTYGVLGNSSTEVHRAHPRRECQPRDRLELVVEKEGHQTSAGMLGICELKVAPNSSLSC